MNANSDAFRNKISKLDTGAGDAYPNSRKIYERGSRDDLRVPMREIRLTATETESGMEENPPLRVYDTSGPYTAALVDLARIGIGVTGSGVQLADFVTKGV